MTGFVCDRMRIAATGELHTPAGGGQRMDSVDAMLVERAWKTLQPKHRELLRWHYIRGEAPGFICRRMGIKPRPTSIFDIELARAEADIARVLSGLSTQGAGFHAAARTRPPGMD